LPSNYTAASTAGLIADINAANQAGGSNTIVLAANTTFNLTAINNTTNGYNGLPVIAAQDNLTITGQGGDIIQRDTGVEFRLLDVTSQGSLTLNNLTLQNGVALGSGSAADGGAIYNQGSLTLNSVTVQANSAVGNPGTHGSGKKANGQVAAGGGIWSSGNLALANGTVIQNNQAVGGFGASGTSGTGGNAWGGGVYIAGGTAKLTGATVNNNSAVGGFGARTSPGGVDNYPTGPGGDGFGGGLYAAATAVVTLCGDTVESNAASGGTGTKNGQGHGGGLFSDQKATLYLDSVTFANTLNNTADIDPNIDGSYTLQNC
jgi:hypothetical protein